MTYKKIFTEKSYQIRIDECIDKYINSIFTEEHIFLYLFQDSIDFIDFKADYGNNTEKIIISEYFASVNKPLRYSFCKPINEYYYKFWEYFSLTPFFKENTIKYMDIFYTNKIKVVLYKLIDKIVWYLPFRNMRDNMRNKIIEEIDKILKYE